MRYRDWFICWVLWLVTSSAGAQPQIDPPEAYASAVKALDTFIAQQVRQHRLPALSIALIDDQQTIWAKGFGYQDPQAQIPATAETVYRVGSVSKLFTDLAIMQLVERGQLDIDAPIQKYLPDFRPKNTSGKAITLRQMMAHQSGLIREPPVGSYFDPTNPPLAKMVESLNGIPLVLPPETKIKYSNAAIATVGYTLEKTQQQPFAAYVRQAILQPLGMKSSDFEPRPELVKNLAKAVMWSYHGREFPAPTFELGMAPAGCMYSTVHDLATFAKVLFREGQLASGRLVKPETLREMFTPQFAPPGTKSGFGIGFSIGEFNGLKRVGHGGAIYGFATEFALLPSRKLGVVVIASRDVANPVVTRIANVCLDHLLAVQDRKRLPTIERTTPLTAEEARRLAGRYRCGAKYFDLEALDKHLWLWPGRGGFRLELRKLGQQLVADDVLGFGLRLGVDGTTLWLAEEAFRKESVVSAPPDPPEAFRGLIGEYGWDHNVLYILEREGQLWALIEWFFLYPLKQESPDVFAFPDFGLYHDEKLIFRRDAQGRATEVEAASVRFVRRPLEGESGSTFRIRPQRPLEQIRREALAAMPPAEKGEFRDDEFVDLAKVVPDLKFDLRYATDNNFLGVPFYPSAHAYLQKPAAEALQRVQQKLKPLGYGLLIFDAYRPWHVTKMFWEATEPKYRHFVADPAQGSRHNRGCAVDVTLYDLKTGQEVPMVSGYDEFSDRAFVLYPGGTARQRWHRDLLRTLMEAEGFQIYDPEWWHFDYRDWRKYRINNATFEQLAAKANDSKR